MANYKQLASSASQCMEDIVHFGFCQSSCSLSSLVFKAKNFYLAFKLGNELKGARRRKEFFAEENVNGKNHIKRKR